MAAAASLCCARGAQTPPATPSLPPIPLLTRAAAEMLVLIIVGNTNRRGTFFCFWFHLLFFFKRFVPFCSLSVGAVLPGECSTFPSSRRRAWVVPGDLPAPCPLGRHHPSLHMMGAPGSLTQGQPPASPLPKAQRLPLFSSTPGSSLCFIPASSCPHLPFPSHQCPPAAQCHQRDRLYHMYFVPLQ